MRNASSGVLLLCLSGVAACEPTQVTAPPQPAPVDVAPPAAPSATVAAGPDLSPVAEPGDIVGLFRWRSPIATASNLASCSGVAPIIVEVNARMAVDMLLRQYIRKGDTRKISALVALDAPVDAIAVLAPEERTQTPLYAISLGLTSLDGAKVAVGAVDEAEIAPGIWPMKGVRELTCGLAVSAGATPARLVCADQKRSLVALAPYLTRTLPGVDSGAADIHAEARVDVLDKRYGASLRNLLGALPGSLSAEHGLDDARFDGALFEAGTDIQDDASKLLGDLRRVTAEIRTERSGACLRARVDADLRDRQSWLAQALTDGLDRGGPPPALYWRLPKDSDLAFYDRGVDPARFAPVMKRARDLLDGALAKEGFASADRRRITDLINIPYSKDTITVIAHGGVNALFPSPGTKDAVRKVLEAGFAGLVGWTMVGVDKEPAVLKKRLKSMVDAYKAQGVQSALKKSMGSDAKHLPVVRSAPAPAALGAGAEALEITVPALPVPPPPDGQGSQKPGTMTLKLHVLLMVDGDGAWLAIGAAKDELVKRLVAAKTGAPDKEQLASRADLEPLRTGKHTGGGFFSAATFTQQITTAVAAAEAIGPGLFGSEMQLLSRGLQAVPNHGKTPVFLTAAGAADATSTKLTFSLDVQQGTLEDTRSLVISAYSLFSRMGIVP